MSPADLARSPAVRLFVERVRDVQPDFRLTSANGPTVAAICRRLDALPLALELAAPWMKVLTPEDLLRRLAHDVLLSTAGPRDLPERQQTINATVAWSYQLLGPNEQRAFRRFGALPGLFPDRCGRGGPCRSRGRLGRERRGARRGGRPDRQEPSPASRDLSGGDLPAVPDARNGAGVRGARARRRGRARRRAGGARALLHRRSRPRRRRDWSDLRRSSGWIACAKISRATAAP